MNKDRKRIRQLTQHFLKRMGLGDWKLTKLVLSPNLSCDGTPSWGWCHIQSHDKRHFHMGIQTGMQEPELIKTIAHEVTHIMTEGLTHAIKAGDKARIEYWEELMCQVVEQLVLV